MVIMNKRMLGSAPPTTLDTIVSLHLFGYKSGRRHRTRRTWFRRRRARLHFRRAHYVSNSDFRANFEIGRTFCRGRIDINFEFLPALLQRYHAARGGYHCPSDLISLRPGGECYPAEDQIRCRDQAKCHFHFHAVNYEPPKARRKILEDLAEPSEAGQLLQYILSKLNRSSDRTRRSWATQLIVQSAASGAKRVDLRVARASFRFNDVMHLTIQRDVSHSFGGSGMALTPTR